MAVAASRHFYRGADPAGHAHFGDGNGKAAVGNIVGGADAAGSNLLLHKKPVAVFGHQINRRRRGLLEEARRGEGARRARPRVEGGPIPRVR